MQENDQTGIRLRDFAVALSLLTRLPIRLPAAAYARGAAAAWAYPLIGLVLGGLSGLVGSALLGIGPGLAAIGAIATTVILSGAMHEDGLADVADGFWGGWERSRRLEIMKDSQIGTYGVMALVLGFAVRWWALTHLFGAGYVLEITIGMAVMSRAAMPVLMAWLPHARRGGLSRSVGRPGLWRAGAAVLLALAIGWAMLSVAAGLIAVLMAVTVGALGLLARTKIGGQTGDVLGAAQQLTEMVGLIALAALLGA